MHIYADIRCLQDHAFACGPMGHHVASLLSCCHSHIPASRIIALIDPDSGELPARYQSIFDRVMPWSQATCVQQQSIFLQASPMTHDSSICARVLDRQGIYSTAIAYDFDPLTKPETYLANPSALRAYTAAMLWLEAYDFYAPTNQSTQRQLFERFGIDPLNSSVTGMAMRKTFEDRYLSNPIESRDRSNCPTTEPYFLFIGDDGPRSNLDVALAAHACGNLGQSHLIIIGNYPEHDQANAIQQYTAAGGKRHRIAFHQDVSEERLADWYSGALATLCCPHAGGFPLSAIEAMACGTPVLASDVEAHCELVCDAQLRFPPNDSLVLQALMQQIVDSPSFRSHAISQQQATPNAFVATEVAARFWQPLLERYAQRFAFADTNSVGYHVASSLPTLAILSPFPNDRTGIADYTARTVQALADKAVVDVFTDAQAPQEFAGVHQFHKISDWAYKSGAYDRVLTVVGNSQFHTKIIDLQRKFGGPCLMHDNRLSELYDWWKGQEYYRLMACKSFGREISHEEAQSWIQDPEKLPGIFFDELLDSANPLIVHSRGIQKQVRKQYDHEAVYLPFSCYRSFEEHELTRAAQLAARARLGIPESALCIVTLGIVAPSKAPEQCLDALEHLRHAGLPAEMYFVGECVSYRSTMDRHAKRLGVTDHIHYCNGWLTDQQYRDYIVAADLGIQLRTNLFGAVSGALLDCIASGLPTVANIDLADTLDAPESVIRISDQLYSRDVSQGLLQAYHRGMHHSRLTDSRQNYVDSHSFDRYTDLLLEILKLRSPQATTTEHAHALA